MPVICICQSQYFSCSDGRWDTCETVCKKTALMSEWQQQFEAIICHWTVFPFLISHHRTVVGLPKKCLYPLSWITVDQHVSSFGFKSSHEAVFTHWTTYLAWQTNLAPQSDLLCHQHATAKCMMYCTHVPFFTLYQIICHINVTSIALHILYLPLYHIREKKGSWKKNCFPAVWILYPHSFNIKTIVGNQVISPHSIELIIH